MRPVRVTRAQIIGTARKETCEGTMGIGPLVMAFGFHADAGGRAGEAAFKLTRHCRRVVRDTTGAVLPKRDGGAASPALIEGPAPSSRTPGSVQDRGTRPGTTVTFVGRVQPRQAGRVELATGFTASVNAELSRFARGRLSQRKPSRGRRNTQPRSSCSVPCWIATDREVVCSPALIPG